MNRHSDTSVVRGRWRDVGFPIIGKFVRRHFQSLEFFAIALVLTFGGPARADDSFAKAESAYKANRFGEAAALYKKILDGGQFAPELFFNLGNSFFKQGEIGQAVLSYRRAWTLAPRDPDIRANLRFALQKADATGPDLSIPARALTRLTMAEWSVLAVASYWIAAALVIAFLVFRRARILLRVAAALAMVGILGVAGLLQWRALRSEPEVVLKERAQALFAPIAEGTPHFALPEGSIVRELEREGDWMRIASGSEVGWIPLKACERVYPWNSRPPL
jgi:tetratricopeptide (TPR) repeat protein